MSEATSSPDSPLSISEHSPITRSLHTNSLHKDKSTTEIVPIPEESTLDLDSSDFDHTGQSGDVETKSQDTDETVGDQDACIALLALQQSPMVRSGVPATPHTAAFRGLELELNPDQIWRIVEKVLRVKLQQGVISYSVSDVALETIRKCTEEFIVHVADQCASIMNQRHRVDAPNGESEIGLREVKQAIEGLSSANWVALSKTLEKLCGRQRRLQESLKVVNKFGDGSSPSMLPTKREMASSPILSGNSYRKSKRKHSGSYSSKDIVDQALGSLSMRTPNIHEAKPLYVASIEVATSLVHSSLSNPFIENALRIVKPAPGNYGDTYSPAIKKRVVGSRQYPSSYSHTPFRLSTSSHMPPVHLPPSGNPGENGTERYLTNQSSNGSSSRRDGQSEMSALDKLASFATLEEKGERIDRDD